MRIEKILVLILYDALVPHTAAKTTQTQLLGLVTKILSLPLDLRIQLLLCLVGDTFAARARTTSTRSAIEDHAHIYTLARKKAIPDID